jgi:hypothetical protein
MDVVASGLHLYAWQGDIDNKHRCNASSNVHSTRSLAIKPGERRPEFACRLTDGRQPVSDPDLRALSRRLINTTSLFMTRTLHPQKDWCVALAS